MKALFERAGVDYRQWRAVSRTLLRSDFRPLGPQADSYSLRTVGGLLLMAMTYGVFGAGAAAVVVINPDVLLTGTVTLSYLAMLLTTALMAHHTSTITSTTDYAILAPQPVSSRTFLAIRLTNILFHALLLTTLMAYPPVAAYTLAHGVSVSRGLAALAAIYAWSLAITCALVALYGTFLRVLGAARLKAVIGYAQMFVGLLAYGGIVLVMQLTGSTVIASAAMPREPWLLLVPPAWFSSYIEIASGAIDGNSLGRAGISLVALGSLLTALRGPLGMSYAERLGELSAVSGERDTRARGRPSWIFTRAEARAVALLVRAHFRHDLRVRLGVLAIVPLTLLYMFLGIRQGAGGDPFTTESGGRAVDLVALAVLFFPTLVVQQFSASDAYRAAWVYFATPADRPALVSGLKNVIVAFFFLPYIAFLALLFTWRFGHAGHAFAHAGFMGLIGYLALQLGALVEPRLPFALPPKKAANSWTMFAWMLMAVVGGSLLMFFLVDWVYDDWLRVAVSALVLIACCLVMNAAVQTRSRQRYRAFEFS